MKRFVLDGPPGSGKSTVAFGVSDGEAESGTQNTLVASGYHCIHESVAEANAILARQGVDFSREKELWLQTIVEIDRDKFSAAGGGINFYDRCFHHWKVMSEGSGIRLPDWYDEFNASVRYDDPVFVFAPLRSIDLARASIPESRRFPWEQRQLNYAHIKEMYLNLGYRVIEVPVFHEGDVERNNLLRMQHILDHLV